MKITCTIQFDDGSETWDIFTGFDGAIKWLENHQINYIEPDHDIDPDYKPSDKELLNTKLE